MDELGELYQELILDHNARPRNFGVLAEASHRAEGTNPLCGDHVTVYLRLAGETIDAVQFDGKGCAISKASASLMTQSLRGKTLEEAERLFGDFHEMVTHDDDDNDGATGADVDDDARMASLGKLAALAGVRGFPMRVKCATLAWHTFHAAATRSANQVSTETVGDDPAPRGLLGHHKVDAP